MVGISCVNLYKETSNFIFTFDLNIEAPGNGIRVQGTWEIKLFWLFTSIKGLITVGRELRQQHPRDLLSGAGTSRELRSRDVPAPDNKSRGCCCRNSRPTVINPDYKQRVLMHGHQGWNVRHGLCHIYMRYVYICELFIAFVSFVVCSLL